MPHKGWPNIFNLEFRCPFLEISMLLDLPESPSDAVLDEKTQFLQDSVKWTNNSNSPRIIKSHLPIAMLPQNLLNMERFCWKKSGFSKCLDLVNVLLLTKIFTKSRLHCM